MSDTTSTYADYQASLLEAPYKSYWERLGSFVSEFSATERALLITIREIADLTDGEVGAALIGGVRVHDGIAMLNRLLDARGLVRPKKRLTSVLWQLGQINTTRNNILHWGAELVSEGVFLVSNKHLIHSKQIPQEYTVTPDELRDMTLDLIKIRIHLAIEGAKDQLPRKLYRRGLRMIVHNAWSYKPPQRAVPAPRSQRTSQKPKRPR